MKSYVGNQVVSDLMNFSTYCCCLNVTGASLLYGLRLLLGPLSCRLLSIAGLLVQLNMTVFAGMINCVTLVHILLSQTSVQARK